MIVYHHEIPYREISKIPIPKGVILSSLFSYKHYPRYDNHRVFDEGIRVEREARSLDRNEVPRFYPRYLIVPCLIFLIDVLNVSGGICAEFH